MQDLYETVQPVIGQVCYLLVSLQVGHVHPESYPLELLNLLVYVRQGRGNGYVRIDGQVCHGEDLRRQVPRWVRDAALGMLAGFSQGEIQLP